MPEPVAVRVPLTQPQAVEETSADVWEGSRPGTAAVILAHGAGTDMQHRTMRRHAHDLADRGHAVALFNFAYTQAGRRSPDTAPKLESCWRDVIGALRVPLGADRPLVVGGRSMGGRIASMVAAADAGGLGITGVVCLAYPLHPPGQPDKLRVDHWPQLTVPILLLSGDRDTFAPIPSLEANINKHMPKGLATLHVLKGADHSFRTRAADGRTESQVFEEAADAIESWLGGERAR